MNNSQAQHIPVLLQEVLDFLKPSPGKVYLDVTLGGGGHTRAILTKEPGCKVIGMDWDQKVIETTGKALEQEFPGRFIPIWGNFTRLDALLAKIKISQVDGILADFGTSQIQIKETPGLSFLQETFLDMRMSQAHQKKCAYDIIMYASEKELADIFWQYGEERASRRIAKHIVEVRKKKYIKTTKQLAELVEEIVPYHGQKIHPATRVFQALRIVVNKELENISAFLRNAIKVLAPGGVLLCISFHSLEDRLVKNFFKEQSAGSGCLTLVTSKVCVASPEEQLKNRSSRSAKLRVAQKKYLC
jgi:16S rRNA (cytosine1402-N4)-methyltransferase